MGLVEISILWIIGALMVQQLIRGVKTVWWKELAGIILWPLVGIYLLVNLTIRRKK